MICTGYKSTCSVEAIKPCDCYKGPQVPDKVALFPMADLLFGEKLWGHLLAASDAGGEVEIRVLSLRLGLSVDVCSWLPPNAILGCTERGRKIVQEMKKKEGQT